jgi:hypothetical protein
VQPILDQHPDARPFFRRSLQRFIDDRNLLVSDLEPGPLATDATAMWFDSLARMAAHCTSTTSLA